MQISARWYGAKSSDTVNGIPRADLAARPLWKTTLSWWLGGQLAATKTGLAIWRKVAAPVEAPLMKATRGRVRLNIAVPSIEKRSAPRSNGAQDAKDASTTSNAATAGTAPN